MQGEGLTFWSWVPDSGEFHSFGDRPCHSLKDWIYQVHHEDKPKVKAFFEHNWHTMRSSESQTARFRIPGTENFESVCLVARHTGSDRNGIVTGMARPDSSGFSSNCAPFLKVSRQIGSWDSAFTTLRKYLGAEICALVEIDQRGIPVTIHHNFPIEMETGEQETRFRSIAGKASLDESIHACAPSPLAPGWREGYSFAIPHDGRRPALVLIWATTRGRLPYLDEFASETLIRTVFSSYRLESERLLRRKSEQLVNQCQKLTGVGKLATGIAHDFNNLLTVIQGHTSFLESALKSKELDRSQESIEQIQCATHQAVDLAKQLLFFSREDGGRNGSCDLNSSVSDFMEMMQRMVEETISIQLHLEENLGAIACDRGALCQILMNLVMNAKEAMPRGGSIRIESSLATPALEENSSPPFASLRIIDSGTGISSGHLSQIFDPFFSTKGQSSGTGLGLANVASIMRQIGGQIDVSSSLDQGTTFELLFPLLRSTSQSTERHSLPTTPAALTGSDESAPKLRNRVLLVEDEASVRKLVRKLLELFGFEVIEAGSGKQALEMWEGVESKISILVTDVVMPEGVSGWDLAKEIHHRNPNLPILVTSGFSERPEDHGLEEEPQISFLQKPYESEALKAEIESLIALSRAEQA